MLLIDLINTKRGVLIDIEGTLIEGIEYENVYPDTWKFLKIIKDKPFLLMTNLARKSRKYVAKRLAMLGIKVSTDKIVNPTIVAVEFLSQRFEKPVKVFLIGEKGHLEDISEFYWIEIRDYGLVDAVLLGANRNLTYPQLNYAFRQIMRGAKLIVLGGDLWTRGRIYDDEGLFLMEGAFATALEVASGTKAIITGKPARIFFEMGLKILEMKAEDVIMIGDSLRSDVIGAVSNGIDVVFVNRSKKDSAEIESALKDRKINGRVFITQSLDPWKEVEILS
ncbi:MAG: HAD-IIA family hydrolase [Candidatus Njordarchaeales archaeon]